MQLAKQENSDFILEKNSIKPEIKFQHYPEMKIVEILPLKLKKKYGLTEF